MLMVACVSIVSTLTCCVFQVCDLSRSRERVKQEVKEKEEEKQQMREGLREALEEMKKLKLLLQVQHLLNTQGVVHQLAL